MQRKYSPSKVAKVFQFLPLFNKLFWEDSIVLCTWNTSLVRFSDPKSNSFVHDPELIAFGDDTDND